MPLYGLCTSLGEGYKEDIKAKKKRTEHDLHVSDSHGEDRKRTKPNEIEKV